jgi:hypothetical protein
MPILGRTLVAVLVAVGCRFLCESMRLCARLRGLGAIHFRRLIRHSATSCDTMQEGQKRT